MDNNNYQDFVNFISKLTKRFDKSTDKYKKISACLKEIKRIEEDTLYLGIIGSFSSGKSTFLNSILHEKLLPTNAMQGTTVSTTIIKKSETEDLIIQYNDGKELSFYRDHETINKKYGPIKMLDLFNELTSNESYAEDIDCITLNLINKHIPDHIGFVDTPGTESLNSHHGEITKKAIENICDAVIVIIPATEPGSIELMDFIKENIQPYINNCIFAVTKVELVEQSELSELLNAIKKRLIDNLDISNPIVLPLATLLYLKNADPKIETSLLDDLSEREKTNLLMLYDIGISTIYSIFDKKYKSIHSDLPQKCRQMAEMSISILNEEVEIYNHRLDILTKGQTMQPEEFEKYIMDLIEQEKYQTEKLLWDNDFDYLGIYNKYISIIASKPNNNEDSDAEIPLYYIGEHLEKLLRIISDNQEKIRSEICDYFNLEYGTYHTIDTNVRFTPIDVIMYDELDEFFFNKSEALEEKLNEFINNIERKPKGFFNKLKDLYGLETLNNVIKEKESLILYIKKEEQQTWEFIENWNSKVIASEYNSLVDYFKELKTCNISAIYPINEDDMKKIKVFQHCKDEANNYITTIKQFDLK